MKHYEKFYLLRELKNLEHYFYFIIFIDFVQEYVYTCEHGLVEVKGQLSSLPFHHVGPSHCDPRPVASQSFLLRTESEFPFLT